MDFGEFRVTPETLVRPPTTRFAPKATITPEALDAMRAIERMDHELHRLAPGRGDLLQRIRREALARNAFATASMEGNPLTLPEVESLLRQDVTPASAHDKDELEILNYAAFMGTPQAAKAPRSPADVLAVHKALFRGVLRDAGAWRSRPNFVGRRADRRVVYVPTAPERVDAEMTLALDWLHDAREHPPLVRALVFHHEFESIHPFRDGNGRAGRALTPMTLQTFGYEGCVYAPIDHEIHKTRADYYARLLEVERNGFTDHTPWLAFMLGIVRRAYAHAVELARFDRALPRDLPERQRRVAEWFAALHQEAPGKRVKFNDVHQAFPEIAERTLKRDLSALRDADVLHATGERKGTTYALRRRDG